ncbi:MAG: ATP-binding protein [Thiomargarita sp.]|nr:ATP-binding protein [Thiomargarita sp.]
MQIKSLSFHNNKTNWHLEKVSFDVLNLLVGISGVGKTKILEALGLIKKVATSKEYELDGIEWKICFCHKDQEYIWELKSEKSGSVSDNSSDNSLIKLLGEKENTKIIFEKITNITKEEVIVKRSNELFEWSGTKVVPKLKRTESVITLLSEEENISPINQAFKNFIKLEANEYKSLGITNNSGLVVDLDKIKLKDEEKKQIHFQEFKKQFVRHPMLVRAFFLQKFYQKQFKELKEKFIDIFPFVEDIAIRNVRIMNETHLFFEIKEYSLRDWIYQDKISSGMFRTLAYLIEISLAPEGSVILIDEFENGLGINCMPGTADFILDREIESQFILTSHHPYIIHNIPWENWQIVTRQGNKVKVTRATDIHELDTASSLDKFTQLINLAEYEEGIS